MFLLDWYKQWIDIRNENREKQLELKVCETCEALKFQLSIANQEKEKLLNRLLEKPEPVVEEAPKNLKPILPRHGMPFNVRRQMLEAEDRARARVLAENSKLVEVKLDPKEPLTVEAIEKELGVAEQ